MMKKICLVDFDMSVRGGVEQVTAALAAGLANRYEVHVISLCMNNELAYQLDERIFFACLLEREKRLREMQKETVPMLRRYFNEHRIDIAILQGNYTGFIASGTRFHTKTKLIFCDHGALMNQWERKDIVAIRWIASMLCHKTVTLTKQSAFDYQRKFHIRKTRVHYIYNWIDLDIPHSECYDIHSKRIISAGRFGKEKGFDQLIHAFNPAAKAHPDWQLDIFGDGEMMDEVKRLIAHYHLEQQVNLMGMCKDLGAQYKNYAMYILPSYREGMPLVLLEAKVNRLPIVSFDIITGPREIVREGVDGILVPPTDTKALGEAMCRLIEDDELRKSMAERSQENLEKFSKTEILKQWEDLIESI